MPNTSIDSLNNGTVEQTESAVRKTRQKVEEHATPISPRTTVDDHFGFEQSDTPATPSPSQIVQPDSSMTDPRWQDRLRVRAISETLLRAPSGSASSSARNVQNIQSAFAVKENLEMATQLEARSFEIYREAESRTDESAKDTEANAETLCQETAGKSSGESAESREDSWLPLT